MKAFLFILISALSLPATEARVESMGNNADFLVDETSISRNPATCFTFGNLLAGSLGRVGESGNRWSRDGQWFGGWAVFPLPVKPGVKMALRATVNRPFDITNLYTELDALDFFTVYNGDELLKPGGGPYVDYLEVLDMKAPYGNIYAFSGVSLNDAVKVAVGGRYAGRKSVSGEEVSTMAVKGGNLGVTYHFGDHFIETSVNYNRFDILKKKDVVYRDSMIYHVNFDRSDNSFDVFMRSFIALSRKYTLTPVMKVVSMNMMGISTLDLCMGMGFSRQLHKGLIWAGSEYVHHTAAYPERVGQSCIYASPIGGVELPAGVKESSHKMIYSFGVEKKIVWDWFAMRVGGNKAYEYLKVTKDAFVIKRGLFERDVDAVAWGVSLGTPDDRLKFDVTVSEAFPYSNPLSGGGDGMLVSRISAALKF